MCSINDHSGSKRAPVIRRARIYLSREGLGPLLIKAVSGSAGLRIAGMGFGFLVGVQLARGLGVESYGIYGLAMSIIAMLTVPTEFGLPQLLTREVASAQSRGDWRAARGILRWSTRTSLLLAALVGGGLLAWLALSGQFGTPLGDTLLAGVALVPIVALLSLYSAALRGAQQIVSGQYAEVVVRPAFHSLLLFMAALVMVPLSPALAVWLGVVAAAASLIVARGMLNGVVRRHVVDGPPIEDGRAWWLSALPMAMTEGMRLLQAHILIFILGVMAAIDQVGLYRMAVSTAALIAMPLSLFNIVSMPLVAGLHSTGQRAQLQKMLTLTALGMTVGVIGLSLPFFLAGEWLLGSVFGKEFAAGSYALSLLCVSVLTNAVFGVNAALLNMTGHQSKVTRASGIALLVLAIAALPLIDAYGISGAAVANLLSVTVWNALMWRDCRKMLGLEAGIWGALLARRD